MLYAILKNKNSGKEHSEWINSDNRSVFEKGTEKGTKKRTEKGTEINVRTDEVVKLIKENPKITQIQMSEVLKISLKRVKLVTNSLQEKGILSREGTRRNGKWIINEKLNIDPKQ